MPNKNGSEPSAHGEALTESQPTLWDTFSHVYGFILQGGEAIKPLRPRFENYLAG